MPIVRWSSRLGSADILHRHHRLFNHHRRLIVTTDFCGGDRLGLRGGIRHFYNWSRFTKLAAAGLRAGIRYFYNWSRFTTLSRGRPV